MEAHHVATTRSVQKLVFSRAISVIAIAAATLTGCATNPVTGEREVNLVSEEKEIQIGKENDAAVRKQYGVYNAPALQAYVNEVGQKLAKHSAIPVWQPSASMVTMQPLRTSVSSKALIAASSLPLPAVPSCPNETPSVVA